MSSSKQPVFREVTFTAVEDLHTGSGTGSGDIDAQVQRDHDGQPVIRASHLRGLLLEAGEVLVRLGKAGQSELDTLFGNNKGTCGTLRMTSLRTTNGNTLVWGSSAREEGSRNPKVDTLRFVEHVAAGTRFSATLRLPDGTQMDLLDSLLKRVDRIGGDRNRGGGLVKLEPSEWRGKPKSNADGVALRLVLRNLEPLCLPTTGHPGNLIHTQSFVRGQALRGALMAWAIQTGRNNVLDVLDRASIGDALPLPEGVHMAHIVLPIPLSIQTEKPQGDASGMPWWAGASARRSVAFDSLDGEKRVPEEKPKRPGADEYLCCTDGGNNWLRYSPAMSVRLRNATPKPGTQGDAELFSMEEIAERTRFQVDLRFFSPEDAVCFKTEFAPVLCGDDWLALGRAGAPTIVESMSTTPSANAKAKDEGWILTLTSDLIVRGEHLGFFDTLDIERLCRLAGIDSESGWVVEDCVVETDTIRGFNAVTGLQRAPALAMRRGSCWKIKGAGSVVLATALAKKPALGERSNEGFGRFRIGLQPITALDKPAGKTQEVKPNVIEALLQSAEEISSKIPRNGPSASQLQWLRNRALAANKAKEIETLLTEIGTASIRRPKGGEAWGRFPVGVFREALDKWPEIETKRQLISLLVQRHASKTKEQRE